MPEIEVVWPAGYSAHRVAAAASEWAEHAPVEADWNFEGARGSGLGVGEMLRDPERRERDAGLGELDEKVATRGHDYGVTLAK